jgi:FAD synthase
MSLTKKRIQDKIEIVGEFKHIQVRYQDQIIENGNVISSSYYRDFVECGNIEKSKEHNVDNIANVIWTKEIKKNYVDYINSLEPTKE